MNQMFLQPINYFILEFFILFWSSFFWRCGENVIQRFFIQRFLIKGGRSPQVQKCMLALCYRLRADPLVKGPQWTKCFDNSLFFVFYKKVLQPINYFFLEILFLFEHPFFYLPFLKRMVLIKGSERGPKALNEPNVWGNSLFFVF